MMQFQRFREETLTKTMLRQSQVIHLVGILQWLYQTCFNLLDNWTLVMGNIGDNVFLK